jgi:ribosomal protein S19
MRRSIWKNSYISSDIIRNSFGFDIDDSLANRFSKKSNINFDSRSRNTTICKGWYLMLRRFFKLRFMDSYLTDFFQEFLLTIRERQIKRGLSYKFTARLRDEFLFDFIKEPLKLHRKHVLFFRTAVLYIVFLVSGVFLRLVYNNGNFWRLLRYNSFKTAFGGLVFDCLLKEQQLMVKDFLRDLKSKLLRVNIRLHAGNRLNFVEIFKSKLGYKLGEFLFTKREGGIIHKDNKIARKKQKQKKKITKASVLNIRNKSKQTKMTKRVGKKGGKLKNKKTIGKAKAKAKKEAAKKKKLKKLR